MNIETHGAIDMKRIDHQNNRPASQPAPLFASSWIALFMLLRDTLTRGTLAAVPVENSPETDPLGRPH